MKYAELFTRHPDDISESTVENAFIQKTSIWKSALDYMVLVIWLQCDEPAEDSFEGLGDNLDNANFGRAASRVLDIAGVSDWSDLPGQPVRISRVGGRVAAIGHFIKDDWFCPIIDFAAAGS